MSAITIDLNLPGIAMKISPSVKIFAISSKIAQCSFFYEKTPKVTKYMSPLVNLHATCNVEESMINGIYQVEPEVAKQIYAQTLNL